MTQTVLEQSSDKFLIDYNYNIEFVISSSSASKIGQPLMVLELFLRVNQDENRVTHSGKSIQRVVLELNKEEAR